MTVVQFIDLPLREKIKLLYEEGRFIVSIRYYRYKVNLYLYNGYYVEAFYDPKADKIADITPMDKNHSRQKFYADQVKLPVLF